MHTFLSAGTDTAFAIAPACVGNIGVGFDLLGHTFFGPADLACVRRAEPGVRIRAIHGALPGVADIPLDPALNTAGRALLALIEGLDLPFGFELELHKGIPLGSGMGGSAASAVAALVAANQVLDAPLSQTALYPFALRGESASTDAAPGDNVGPMLTGGLALAPATTLLPLAVPEDLYCVVVRPDSAVETRAARAVLEAPFPLATCVGQTTRLALVLTGLARGDFNLIESGLEDVMIEPRRADSVPGFHATKAVSATAGALGCSLSGSGPAIFAWFKGLRRAVQGEARMREALAPFSPNIESWVSTVQGPAAQTVSASEAAELVMRVRLPRDPFRYLNAGTLRPVQGMV